MIIILSTLLAATQSAAQEAQPNEAESLETLEAARRRAAVEEEIAQTRPTRLNPSDGSLTTFDLDFPGGTPRELVNAIEQSMGRPLNAIVPNELSDQPLPPLRMTGVTVAELFGALEQASRAVVGVNSGRSSQYYHVAFGFKTQGRPSDNSVWYFYRDGRPPPPAVSRFYLLTPYLNEGLTVDDITTAIQTGWEMSGASQKPALSFHRETNLLIAVGEEIQLQTINAVLGALTPNEATPPAAPPGASEPQAKQE